MFDAEVLGNITMQAHWKENSRTWRKAFIWEKKIARKKYKKSKHTLLKMWSRIWRQAKKTEITAFLDNYLKQVDILPNIITSWRKADWEANLAAAEAEVKYLFAHELFHYGRLIPVHLAQMKKLRAEDDKTWNATTQGDFVRNSAIPLTAMIKILSSTLNIWKV